MTTELILSTIEKQQHIENYVTMLFELHPPPSLPPTHPLTRRNANVVRKTAALAFSLTAVRAVSSYMRTCVYGQGRPLHFAIEAPDVNENVIQFFIRWPFAIILTNLPSYPLSLSQWSSGGHPIYMYTEGERGILQSCNILAAGDY